VNRSVRVDAQGTYPLLGVRLDGGGAFLRETVSGLETSATKLNRVSAGDFIYSRLFAWRGAFGIIGPELEGAFVSGEFPLFRAADDRLDVGYLGYWFRLRSTLARVEADCTGSTPLTRNRFKEEFFAALDIRLPPLAEQRRVVRRLESLGSRLARLSALREESAAMQRQMAMAQRRAMLARVQACGSMRRLGEIVQVRGGGTPAKDVPHFWGGEIPWITPKDMKRHELTDAIDHITAEATTRSSAKLIPQGAVLIVVRGMILARIVPCALLAVPAAINQDMKALLPDERVLPEYLNELLRVCRYELCQLVSRSTHDTRKLETETLLDFPIPVPPIETQRLFVERSTGWNAIMDELGASGKGIAMQSQALSKSLLSSAFNY
jgi:restriction endonuclease S subunit